MPERVFLHNGEQWSVGYVGASHGTGSVMPVALTRHQMLFTRASDGLELRGHLWTKDVHAATEAQVIESLLAIRARENWRATCPKGHSWWPNFGTVELLEMISTGSVKVWCNSCGDEWQLSDVEVKNLKNWLLGDART